MARDQRTRRVCFLDGVGCQHPALPRASRRRAHPARAAPRSALAHRGRPRGRGGTRGARVERVCGRRRASSRMEAPDGIPPRSVSDLHVRSVGPQDRARHLHDARRGHGGPALVAAPREDLHDRAAPVPGVPRLPRAARREPRLRSHRARLGRGSRVGEARRRNARALLPLREQRHARIARRSAREERVVAAASLPSRGGARSRSRRGPALAVRAASRAERPRTRRAGRLDGGESEDRSGAPRVAGARPPCGRRRPGAAGGAGPRRDARARGGLLPGEACRWHDHRDRRLSLVHRLGARLDDLASRALPRDRTSRRGVATCCSPSRGTRTAA